MKATKRDPLLDGIKHRPPGIDTAAYMMADAATILPVTPKSPGRRYTPEQRAALIAEACARVRSGESVRQIACLDHMPTRSELWGWLTSPEAYEDYRAAKFARLEHYEEEIQEIAEDGRNDWIEIENERTGRVQVVLDKEHVARSKLRIETRQWLMGKLDRAKYGERTTVDLNATVRLEPAQAMQRAGALLSRLETLARALPAVQQSPANDAAVALPMVQRVNP